MLASYLVSHSRSPVVLRPSSVVSVVPAVQRQSCNHGTALVCYLKCRDIIATWAGIHLRNICVRHPVISLLLLLVLLGDGGGGSCGGVVVVVIVVVAMLVDVMVVASLLLLCVIGGGA